SVRGAIELHDGRLVSWGGSSDPFRMGKDITLRLWDRDGSPITIIAGHTRSVFKVIQLTNRRLLSYGEDSTLRLWDEAGTNIPPITKHADSVRLVKLQEEQF
ncbi:MAG TPA: hypothetical protein PLZ51_13375, partial [Aggregatilineales bacterium]|nr:hypothetical protein [Aggregatilineales bacterium]